eukprot:9682777-Alexandrium_andersonii.AAC.1
MDIARSILAPRCAGRAPFLLGRAWTRTASRDLGPVQFDRRHWLTLPPRRAVSIWGHARRQSFRRGG